MQDPRIQRLPCTHSGTYADDCLCDRVRQHKCYIVATCDRDLRRRIRKVLVTFSCFVLYPLFAFAPVHCVASFCSYLTFRSIKSTACSCSQPNSVALALYPCSIEQSGNSILQIPGVPIMYLASHRYTIERLPEATMGGAPRN